MSCGVITRMIVVERRSTAIYVVISATPQLVFARELALECHYATIDRP